MKRTEKLVFKAYEQHQPQMFPQSIDEIVEEHHVVRVVNRMLDGVALEPLIKRYKGGGTSCYHPGMMLKVIVYAYSQRLYTSRRIAKALRENVHFMWLAGGNKPDFRTIASFRRDLGDEIRSIFATTVDMLQEEGFVRFEDYFLDGTKIESVANKYTFVWRKSVEKNREKLEAKLHDLFARIDAENVLEDEAYGDKDLPERGAESKITPEMLAAKTRELNEILARMPENKELAREAKKIEKDYQPRLERYEAQQELFGDRNSFSKTDQDATFMRMKEDAMRNGQLKPGYNVQVGTENQFVVGYSVHQKPADTTTLVGHLEELREAHGVLPHRVVADAGYGSEENYAWLEDAGVEAYVKFNTFDLEKRPKYRDNKFRTENLPYDAERDAFTCPAGKRLPFAGMKRKQSKNGFQINLRLYRCEDCSGCPHRDSCHRGQGDRTIEISPRREKLRGQARERLSTGPGIALRKRRCVEVESVFGHIKQCRGFRRFHLKGLEGARIEWGILAMAHNFMKVAVSLKQRSAEA